MADNKMELAQQVYQTLCGALNSREWKYGKDEEKLLVHFGVNGDDLPMDFIIIVDAERQLVRLMSPLNFKISEEKRMEGAIATCAVTFGLADGCFDYDLSNGRIVFRMATTYRGSQIGEDLFHYMISCACAMVDAYNDKFLALDKGLISVSDFIEKKF